MEMPEINLGQYPKRTFEDLRLQTTASLDECSSTYFYVYPSHPGIVIRQLHHLLVGFMYELRNSRALRCLVWGRAGDVAHLDKYLKQFRHSIPSELHAVVSRPDDEDWVRSQVPDADVWYEGQVEGYVQPPAPQHYFNCVIIMGGHRQQCLEASREYLNTDLPCMLLAVDDEDCPYCFDFEGKFYMGGPVWRGK